MNSNFKETLLALVEACEADEAAIQKIKSATKDRQADALVKHGIDPATVRSLILWRKAHAKDPTAIERAEELNQVYRIILAGGTPTIPSRADAELEKVLRLTNSAKPPKIETIMHAIGCSRGKASKLRNLAAARLAAKSSSSSEPRERELSRGIRSVLLARSGRLNKRERELTAVAAARRAEQDARAAAVQEAEIFNYPTADTVAPIEFDVEAIA